MVTWGLIASSMMFVTGAKSFHVLRFLLGFAKAGFSPSMILYLSHWFPRKYLVTATALAGVIGGAISHLWRCMALENCPAGNGCFFQEGIPAVVPGIVVFFLPAPNGRKKPHLASSGRKNGYSNQLARKQREKANEPERGASSIHTRRPRLDHVLYLFYARGFHVRYHHVDAVNA